MPFDFLDYCCIPTASHLSNSRSPEDARPYTDERYSTVGRDEKNAQDADDFVRRLLRAKRDDAVLQADLQSIFNVNSWRDGFAAAILNALERAIESGVPMSPVIEKAYSRACSAVKDIEAWADANPDKVALITTLIALGVLALTVPWLLAYLGFTEEGILAATWAARWQRTYYGFVPKGSLFSYLQSLGTKIGRAWRP